MVVSDSAAPQAPAADVAILVVEDNPDHRELILLALRECCEASRLAAVDDGTEALDAMERQVHDRRRHRARAVVR